MMMTSMRRGLLSRNGTTIAGESMTIMSRVRVTTIFMICRRAEGVAEDELTKFIIIGRLWRHGESKKLDFTMFF